MAVERHQIPTLTPAKRFSPELLLGARIVTTVPTGDPSVAGRTILLATVRSIFSGFNILLIGPHDLYPTAEEMEENLCIFVNYNSVVYDVSVPSA